jgi:hypothetical protein
VEFELDTIVVELELATEELELEELDVVGVETTEDVVEVVVDFDSAKIPAPAIITIITMTTTIMATRLIACLNFLKVKLYFKPTRRLLSFPRFVILL